MDPITLKNLQQAARKKEARTQNGLLVIEGDKVVEELAEERKLEYILTSDPDFRSSTPVHCVKREWIEKISTCKTPQALLGVAKIPKPVSLHQKKWVLVLDRLQDPGNVGTLIRTAHALGWEGVFFLEPCCDPFNDKALRASRSSLFHLPYYIGSMEEMVKMCPTTIAVADLKGSRPSKQEALWLILGQEGQGIQENLHQYKKFSIPMKVEAESLNVSTAGSILLYVLKTV